MKSRMLRGSVEGCGARVCSNATSRFVWESLRRLSCSGRLMAHVLMEYTRVLGRGRVHGLGGLDVWQSVVFGGDHGR